MSNDHGESDIIPTESGTTRTAGNFPHGSRETPGTSVSTETDRSAKARCRNADMHVLGESDSSIVPKKLANNDSVTLSAESVEGRELAKENAKQSPLDRTQSRTHRSRGLQGVREAARRDKRMPLHPYPEVRFDRQHPRQEPYAVVPHVRICAGGGPQGPSLPR